MTETRSLCDSWASCVWK